MMLVAGPVVEASAMLCTGRKRRLGVVLGDADEEERRDDAADAAAQAATSGRRSMK